MDFHASPAIIEDFSEVLGKQEEHAEAAERYAKAHLEISDRSDGIIAELPAGRMTPAEVLTTRAYDEALAPGAEALTSWYATTSEEDREAAASLGRAELVRLTEDELAGVPDGPVAQVVPEPDEDLSERTWSGDSW